jgi:MFS family permease
VYKENFDCSPKQFCNNPKIRAEKIQSKTMINNWVTDFNLECAEPGVIPAFYLVLYVGLALGGLILGPMTDSYGKKVIFIISLAVILIMYGLILIMNDWSHLHAYIFFYGFALAGAIISGLLYHLQ